MSISSSRNLPNEKYLDFIRTRENYEIHLETFFVEKWKLLTWIFVQIPFKKMNEIGNSMKIVVNLLVQKHAWFESIYSSLPARLSITQKPSAGLTCDKYEVDVYSHGMCQLDTVKRVAS